jgi:hypothetical protein
MQRVPGLQGTDSCYQMEYKNAEENAMKVSNIEVEDTSNFHHKQRKCTSQAIMIRHTCNSSIALSSIVQLSSAI